MGGVLGTGGGLAVGIVLGTGGAVMTTSSDEEEDVVCSEMVEEGRNVKVF